MKTRNPVKLLICCVLFLSCLSVKGFSTPGVLSSGVGDELDKLLFWAEQTYFVPSKISLKDVNPQKPHHLENLAVILGAVLQSQVKFLAKDPQLEDSFTRLKLAAMVYLASRTSFTEIPDDWQRLWKDFTLESLAGKLNGELKKKSLVDPANTNIPSLLSSPGRQDQKKD